MTLGYYHQADFALNSTPSSTCQRGMSRFDCKSFLAEGQSTDYCLGRGNAKQKGLNCAWIGPVSISRQVNFQIFKCAIESGILQIVRF